jgi:hypothetical protein
MAVKIISGIPGSGKTLLTTILSNKHYDSENKLSTKVKNILSRHLYNFKIYRINLLRKLFKKQLFNYRDNIYKTDIFNQDGKINNVYTNYSVLLDDKLNLYSNITSLYDLDNRFSFLPYAFIVIDEIQVSVDSDEFQDKASRERFRPIARFMQTHRHYGIKDIYIVSQHPSRVMKKVRDIAEEFVKITHFIKIPFIGIGIITMIRYFNFDDYGKSVKVKKELINFDYKKKFMIFKYKKYYRNYDTCYRKADNLGKPLLNKGTYKSKIMTKEEIDKSFFEE